MDKAFENADAPAFVARLQKNARHLGKFARRIGTDAYRIYDADVPNYNAAIDRYADHFVIAEYAPPKTVAADIAASRLRDLFVGVSQVFDAAPERIVMKQRRRQSPTTQYGKTSNENRLVAVQEGDAKYLVNLGDRLDTGLYLDHRGTREFLRARADGKSVLNLFAYTATATVAVALGGARRSVSVDWSNTYIDWGSKNLRENGISETQHVLFHFDCNEYVAGAKDRFDLVFVDPPTFSNRSGIDETFEVQRDHGGMLRELKRLLPVGGEIVFSTHAQRFKLDETLEQSYRIRDVTKATLHEDFKRSPKIHQAWLLTRAR